MLPPSEMPPTRAALRKLLAAVLKADSDLDAFCLDHFFQVKQRYFSDGMQRLVKINLLLEFAEPEEILDQLDRHYHGEVIRHWELLQEDPRATHAARRLQELRVERERLEQARQILLQHSIPSMLLTEVDSKLLRLRREQRQGPLLNEGELVANRYSIMQKLGQGGFASVWLAYDRFREPRIVAVKVLHGQFAKDQSYIDRFLRGARKMAELVHDHIVPVIGGPEWDHELGLPYFVMPYLAGGDLRDAVLRQEFRGESALSALMQIGQALAYAHRNGLVHRDVKPQNILLDHQGRAYLTDFDLVLGPDNTFVSRTGQGAGSVTYAAPEQLQNSKLVDKRADVYSLAMTALFVLRAEELPPTAMAQTDAFISDLRTSDHVKQALSRALKWLPDQRTASAMEFCGELQHALEQPDADSIRLDSNCSSLGGPPSRTTDGSSSMRAEQPDIAQPLVLSPSQEPAAEGANNTLSLAWQSSVPEESRVRPFSTTTPSQPTRWLAGSVISALLAYFAGSLITHRHLARVGAQESTPLPEPHRGEPGQHNAQVVSEQNPGELSASMFATPAAYTKANLTIFCSAPDTTLATSPRTLFPVFDDVALSATHSSPGTGGSSISTVQTSPVQLGPSIRSHVGPSRPATIDSQRSPLPRKGRLGPAPPLTDNQSAAPVAATSPRAMGVTRPKSQSSDELRQYVEIIKLGQPKARAGDRTRWLSIGLAACRVSDASAATEAYQAATPAERIEIATECYTKAGYKVTDNAFQTRP